METAIDEMEAIVDEVSTILAEEIQLIVDTIAPDGRPYGQQLKSDEEQLIEYRTIRNDVESWKIWISNKAMEITTQLQMSGVGEDKIAAINPLNIAIAFMLDYSVKMEKKLQDRMI